MRYKLYSIFYLVVIAFYLVRPSLPYIEYAFKRDYIEKNLCVEKEIPESSCHGKCYLRDQLEKQNEQQDSDLNDSKIMPDKRMDDHLNSYSAIPGIFAGETIVPDYYIVSRTISFALSIFVPPKI